MLPSQCSSVTRRSGIWHLEASSSALTDLVGLLVPAVVADSLESLLRCGRSRACVSGNLNLAAIYQRLLLFFFFSLAVGTMASTGDCGELL